MRDFLKRNAVLFFLCFYAAIILYGLIFNRKTNPARVVYFIQSIVTIFLVIGFLYWEKRKTVFFHKTSADILRTIAKIFFYERRLKDFINPFIEKYDELQREFENQIIDAEAIDRSAKKLYQFLRNNSYLGSLEISDKVGPMLLNISRAKFAEADKINEFIQKAYRTVKDIEAIIVDERNRIQNQIREFYSF